jgi:hypothetical protein
MRRINLSTPGGNMELEVTQALEEHIAKKHSVPASAVTDSMIVRFFRDASDTAFKRAAAEYLDSDGKDT